MKINYRMPRPIYIARGRRRWEDNIQGVFKELEQTDGYI
jgi:hypothetical protein